VLACGGTEPYRNISLGIVHCLGYIWYTQTGSVSVIELEEDSTQFERELVSNTGSLISIHLSTLAPYKAPK
jgi:hypothetical protein